MFSRTIYDLRIDETQGTYFEIKNGKIFMRNYHNGIKTDEFTYYALFNITSNNIILSNPEITAEEWTEKINKEIVEYIDDISELPNEYKILALKDIDEFIKDFKKLVKKKIKAMKKENFDETDIGIEGSVFCKETKKILCYICKENKPVKRCGACLNIHYCSPECAKIDWKRHKQNCVKK